jgi:hypothetical protein
MIDLGHWECKIPIPENPFGMVYVITNIIDNKKYIGKKQMLTKKRKPPLKGKKRKRISIVETDWKTYTSSSSELNEDIKKHGKDNFKFEIIRFCNSKSEMAYFEAKEQFDKDALIREDYYNGIVNLRISKIKF